MHDMSANHPSGRSSPAQSTPRLSSPRSPSRPTARLTSEDLSAIDAEDYTFRTLTPDETEVDELLERSAGVDVESPLDADDPSPRLADLGRLRVHDAPASALFEVPAFVVAASSPSDRGPSQSRAGNSPSPPTPKPTSTSRASCSPNARHYAAVNIQRWYREVRRTRDSVVRVSTALGQGIVQSYCIWINGRFGDLLTGISWSWIKD